MEPVSCRNSTKSSVSLLITNWSISSSSPRSISACNKWRFSSQVSTSDWGHSEVKNWRDDDGSDENDDDDGGYGYGFGFE